MRYGHGVYIYGYLKCYVLIGCSAALQVTNAWTTGTYYHSGGFSNGKQYWSNNLHAVWYDGHSGVDFDWYFGDAGNVGGTTGNMWSDENTQCPSTVGSWTKDSDAIVTTGIFHLLGFGRPVKISFRSLL